ncbi:hypothetical protein EG328_001259 [Venturia inaequalis]|uniref:Uncharacterized protein n=1 Tax=Venturia inaequalis TaxID=5025 RepID=A0A8H3Z0K6_VENIN|nr:hypothetical protein EG328_001259 [Venturia inaequalis]
MNLTFPLLLAASLATSVSADSYTLCCCTKPKSPKDTPDPRLFVDNPRTQYMDKPVKQCDHDATKFIVDTMRGHFMFSPHFWVGTRGRPKHKGANFIFSTGLLGDDTLIGQKEMAGWCGKKDAERYCWSPGPKFYYNYRGEFSGNSNGIS